MKSKILASILAAGVLTACSNHSAKEPSGVSEPVFGKPLVTHMYTADPSARVFNGRLYVYPSHDWDSGVPEDDTGAHFDMKDYHVFSMDQVGGKVVDHGTALHVRDVPWAERQMWAPDAVEKNGKYYLYFPARDKEGVFRIGVAAGDKPEGPFKAQPQPISGSYSIDPGMLADDDGEYYMYFGGIWGGQLQRWQTGSYVGEDSYPKDDQPALTPKIARMSGDMLSFAEEPKDVVILCENGHPLKSSDNARRFFEAAWVHKYQGTYYLSYSTGDTHFIQYATSDNPYGPFHYKGKILEPVLGWTNHHSVVQHQGKWYLFYHDSSLSGGRTHLRSMKVTELTHNADGTIKTVDALVDEQGLAQSR
jgi:beta-xylosidase